MLTHRENKVLEKKNSLANEQCFLDNTEAIIKKNYWSIISLQYCVFFLL